MSSFDAQSAWHQLEYAEQMAVKMVVGYEYPALREWRRNLEEIEKKEFEGVPEDRGIDALLEREFRKAYGFA